MMNLMPSETTQADKGSDCFRRHGCPRLLEDVQHQCCLDLISYTVAKHRKYIMIQTSVLDLGLIRNVFRQHTITVLSNAKWPLFCYPGDVIFLSPLQSMSRNSLCPCCFAVISQPT